MSSQSLNEEFVPEAEELLDQIESHLHELGRPDETPERVADRLNALFRCAHSLKGMAGMAGLTEVSQLSHDLEELMDHLRMGRLAVETTVIEIIGDGMALLRRLVAVVAGRSGGATPAPSVDELARFDTQLKSAIGKPSRSDASPLDLLGIPAHLASSLTTYEEHRLRENLRMGRTLYAVKAGFQLETFDRQLAALSSKLQELGEVVTTAPQTGDSIAVGEIGFELILGSMQTSEAVTGAVGDMADEVVVLGKAAAREPSGLESSDAAGVPASTPTESVASIRSLSETVRVEIRQLDHLLNVMGELVLQKSVLYQLAKDYLERDGSSGLAGELLKTVQSIEHRLAELQGGLVEARMIPLGQLFDRLVRAARKLSKELNKEVDLRMSGEETRLDKTMVEAIADPLLHILRNAMDHGMEMSTERLTAGKPKAGQITLRARPQGNSVVIDVTDDGRGINLARVREVAVERGLADPDKSYEETALINFMFQPGFSTTAEVSEISGRGVGLDVVAKNIAMLGGLVDVTTVEGKGTTFSITLPITLVIVRSLIVRAGSELFAIPLSSVTETLMIEPSQILTVDGAEAMELRNRTLPLLRLESHFSCATRQTGTNDLYVIVVGVAENRLGLVVDAIEGQQEVVIKSVGGILTGTVPGIAGAAELGNRQMILVLDIAALLGEAAQLVSPTGK